MGYIGVITQLLTIYYLPALPKGHPSIAFNWHACHSWGCRKQPDDKPAGHAWTNGHVRRCRGSTKGPRWCQVGKFGGSQIGCFLKWWYPQIIYFHRVFHYKPSILRYLFFWKHPIDWKKNLIGLMISGGVVRWINYIYIVYPWILGILDTLMWEFLIKNNR